ALKDSLVEELLDQPAQVALWRGADGRLRDFVVVLKRGGLARVLEPLAHKEILEVPLLRDTLTEDFVFYYENNGDRLGLTGTLRRIIYEHDLALKDSLVEELLDQPAQVALWRGADGRLRDFVVV
ncbi:DUF2138 family protein, partial [Klebsiella pneumoniae subsp. pneumoniae]